VRRTKAALIYRRTKNLRVGQLLLGHSKLESTVSYLGIDVDDALEIAEQTEVYTGAFVSIRKLQLPLDRLEARLLAQGIHERIGLQQL
jgi:hypothetical protein